MATARFYNSLKVLQNFDEIMDIHNYSTLPDDWFVIVTDIEGSTKAIEEGKYKEVNFVGAMSIISILNIDKTLDIPFVFGGDGASIIIPKSMYESACVVLANLRELVKQNYGFELRVGIIEVSEIYAHKKQILITKYEVSEYYIQAIIQGGGLQYADYLLKNHFEKYKLYAEATDYNSVDFSGLECRWEAIPSPKDEVLSLLIKASELNSEPIYKDVLKNIETILGNSLERSPLRVEDLQLTFDTKKLSTEASLYSKNSFVKYLYIMKMKAINLLGKILMSLKITQWGEYKKHIFKTTDTQKFDDMLRMVVSTNKKQTALLEAYLQGEYTKKNLVYGIHKSNSSLMTCLVFQRHGKHVHFIDGSDGGYAFASKDFKERLLSFTLN
jgi:hypothetical protein